MAAVTTAPIYLYTSEQAVLDQLANGNAHSRDFSFVYNMPVKAVPANESLTVTIPTFILPHPNKSPALSWVSEGMINYRWKVGSSYSSSKGSFLLYGVNDNNTVNSVENPAMSELSHTAVLTTTKTSWNAVGASGLHTVNTVLTLATSAEARSVSLILGMSGVHSIIGG